jgi:hypothetical protein
VTTTAYRVRWDRIQNVTLGVAVFLTVFLVLWHDGSHVCATAHRPAGLTLTQWREAMSAICGSGN